METGTTLFDLMANEIAQLIFAQSLSSFGMALIAEAKLVG
jgi:hypothetical protein